MFKEKYFLTKIFLIYFLIILGSSAFAEENYYQDKVCIRTKKYKFIKTVGRSICEMCRVKHGEDTELFNLVNDPGELINIATSNRKLVEEFEEKIKSIITSQE